MNKIPKTIAVGVIALAALLVVGLVQNYFNNPVRGCTKTDSAPEYWQYDCKDGRTFWQEKDDPTTQAALVYSVCNQSRISPTITEGECGRLQDKWNIEFICAANNQNPNTRCWTESK